MFQGNLAETLNWCHLILWLGYTTVLPLILCLSMDMLKFMMPYLSNYQHTGWKDVESEILFCLHLNMSKNKNPHPPPSQKKIPTDPLHSLSSLFLETPNVFVCLFWSLVMAGIWNLAVPWSGGSLIDSRGTSSVVNLDLTSERAMMLFLHLCNGGVSVNVHFMKTLSEVKSYFEIQQW